MPLTTVTGGVQKSFRRFRYSLSNESSTWTDSTYRYVKWLANGSLTVLELPMDGNVNVEYQIVAGGGGGGGGIETYNYSSFFKGMPGGGGGAGMSKFGSVSLVTIKTNNVFVGAGGSGASHISVPVGIGQNMGSGTTGTSGSNSSFGGTSTVGGLSGGAGAGYASYSGSGSTMNAYSYNYTHYAGDGGTSGSGVAGTDPGEGINDGGVGGNGKTGSDPATLWDGSAYSIGGYGGPYSSNVNVPSSNPVGYGHGGSGSVGWNGIYVSSYTEWSSPSQGAARDGTQGVVIVRWLLSAEAHG